MAKPAFPSVVRSCSTLYFHFIWGIVMMVVGLLALTARLIPRVRPYHKYIGMLFFYGMILQLFTSLWAHDDGFPWFVFAFGLTTYGSLIAGQILINAYRSAIAEEQAAAAAIARPSYPPTPGKDGEMGYGAGAPVVVPAMAPRRRLSPKAYMVAHGICMCLGYGMTVAVGMYFLVRYSWKPRCVSDVKWDKF
ncbi:hypothetical protein HK102_000123 [Quaeritorhiza haematococci]|nr:hypothetical protein HK102_000123 [Quaeritorhiza haematococci]